VKKRKSLKEQMILDRRKAKVVIGYVRRKSLQDSAPSWEQKGKKRKNQKLT